MPNLLSNDKKGKIKKMSTVNISEIGRLLWETACIVYISIVPTFGKWIYVSFAILWPENLNNIFKAFLSCFSFSFHT